MGVLKAINDEAERFLNENSSNRMGGQFGDERIWMSPLLGSAAGDDTIFEQFRQTVDKLHWTPQEAFAAGGYETVPPECLSVVSWVLPHSDLTRKDNAKAEGLPSERWARSRVYGEAANTKLRDHIVEFLRNTGIDSVSPMRLEGWTEVKSERYVYASNWSERHIAHACGLGTFGLCDGLITPLGKSVRLGSIVLKAQVEPTPRPYSSFDEYCPFREENKCGACIKRCPVGALSEKGHDKIKCQVFLHGTVQEYLRDSYGIKGYGCGLCQTGVPCASGIPKF